jgi:hypothetical protein
MNTIRQMISSETHDIFTSSLKKLLYLVYATLGQDFSIIVQKIENDDGSYDLDLKISRLEPIYDRQFKKLQEIAKHDR